MSNRYCFPLSHFCQKVQHFLGSPKHEDCSQISYPNIKLRPFSWTSVDVQRFRMQREEKNSILTLANCSIIWNEQQWSILTHGGQKTEKVSAMEFYNWNGDEGENKNKNHIGPFMWWCGQCTFIKTILLHRVQQKWCHNFLDGGKTIENIIWRIENCHQI